MKLCYASEPFLLVKRLSKGVTLTATLALFGPLQLFSQNLPSQSAGNPPAVQSSSIKPNVNPQQFTFLPGTLIDWSVKVSNKKVSLSWATTVEKNSNRFVVLKSMDGEHYEEVAELTAAGNSDKIRRYACGDNVFSTKGLVYYRLKMVDKDLKEHYSDVKMIRSDDETSALTIYPNPAINELRVTVSSTWQGKELVFDIYNNHGQLVRNKRNQAASQTESMNVTDLPAGIYIVKVSNGGENMIRQFIKSKS